jgi:hypothetical protein
MHWRAFRVAQRPVHYSIFHIALRGTPIQPDELTNAGDRNERNNAFDRLLSGIRSRESDEHAPHDNRRIEDQPSLQPAHVPLPICSGVVSDAGFEALVCAKPAQIVQRF